MMYHGSVAKRNGAGIIIAKTLQDKVVDIKRKSERLMKFRIVLSRDQIFIVICGYVPLIGCAVEKKEEFQIMLDQVTSVVW